MNTNKLRIAFGKNTTAAILMAGLLVGSQQRLASQSAVPPCEPVNAQLDGSLFHCAESPVGFCAIGTITTGPLKGSKSAVYQGASPSAGMPNAEAPSALSYSGTQVFHTERGDLFMSVVGVSDNARQVFTELARITGGTGRFTDASGDLFISGTLTPDGFGFQSKVTGEICFGGAHPELNKSTALPAAFPQQLPVEATAIHCQPVNAPWDGGLVFGCSQSPGGVCAAGTIGSGLLKGSTATVYYGLGTSAGMPNVEPATTVSYSGVQVIHTEKGDLHASAVGIADMHRHVFTEISRISGGTGRFANASGNLFVSGNLAHDGIGFESRITGEICFDPIRR